MIWSLSMSLNFDSKNQSSWGKKDASHWSVSSHPHHFPPIDRAPMVHNSDVIMSTMVSQITSPSIVYSTVYSGADQRKISKHRVTGLCAGNSPVTGEFPAQRASNAKNASIWWLHHGYPEVLTREQLVLNFPQIPSLFEWYARDFFHRCI